MRSLICLILALGFVRPCLADGDFELREKINQVVFQRSPRVSPNWWHQLGPDASKVILSMCRETTRRYKQIRLMESLGNFGDAEAIAYLKDQAMHADNGVIRATAIRTLIASQGMKEEKFLGDFLRNPDPQTRLATAEALRELSDPRAQALVDAYLKEEKTPWIVERLSRP